MPSHSKAIRELAFRHAVSEALGIVGVTAYLGVVTGLVLQFAVTAGFLG